MRNIQGLILLGLLLMGWGCEKETDYEKEHRLLLEYIADHNITTPPTVSGIPGFSTLIFEVELLDVY